MRRGDFIITPSGAWHSHNHEGNGAAIWVDGLDLPIVNFFEASFLEHSASGNHQIERPEGYSVANFGSGLAPFNAQSPFGSTSPVFNYGYDRSRGAVTALERAVKADPYVGYALRYTNPLDGGWAMPTMATWLRYLPAGFESKPMRATDGQILVVLEGEACVEVEDQSFTIRENDVFVVPTWMRQRAHARKNTILFCFSDRSAQEKLGLWHQELG